VDRRAAGAAPLGGRAVTSIGGFVDLSLDRTALLALLRGAGLVAVGEDPQVQSLTGGVSSTILRVTLRSGDVCVKQALPKLRVAKDWHAPTDRVFAEMDWLEAVGRILPQHVPRLLARDVERGALVMEYLAPACHLNWKSELLGGRLHAKAGGAMGDILGRIHAHSAQDPNTAQRFDHDANFFALRLEPYFVETSRQHPDLRDHLLGLVARTQANKHALVHGDVSPKNILLGPVGAILLDAECACHGDPAFDLAFLLNHLLLKAMARPVHAAALAALFTDIGQRYRRHITWEDPDALEFRAATLLPALLLARIDGKSPVEYLSETQRAATRTVARHLITSGPKRLNEVLAVANPPR